MALPANSFNDADREAVVDATFHDEGKTICCFEASPEPPWLGRLEGQGRCAVCSVTGGGKD